MKRLWRTATSGGAGGIALVFAALLLAGPAQAFPGRPSPAIHLAMVGGACAVTKMAPPAGRGGIVLFIKVPSESTLKSITLKTRSGELVLDVTETLPLVGEYATIIDSQEAKCAASGVLLLDLETDLETSTVACPEVPLFKPEACD